MALTDKQLITAAKKDGKKYEALYKKYDRDVFNYFWYRVGHNKSIAEDLMQDVFVRAFKNLAKYKELGYSYRTYLLTIAHNTLVNYFRQPEAVSLEEAEHLPDDTLSGIDDKLAAQSLWSAIHSLPDLQRDVLLLFYREEMSIKEVADVVGKSENAVKITLSRGRSRLSKHPDLEEMAKFRNYQKRYSRPKFMSK